MQEMIEWRLECKSPHVLCTLFSATPCLSPYMCKHEISDFRKLELFRGDQVAHFKNQNSGMTRRNAEPDRHKLT